MKHENLILFFVLAVGFMQICGATTTKHHMALFELEDLESAIHWHYDDTGRYPDEAIGLRQLITNINLLENWDGPYIVRTEVPVDPWGGAYVYRFPAADGGEIFDLYSQGADKNDNHGKGDDISIWAGVNAFAYWSQADFLRFALAILLALAVSALVLYRIFRNRQRV